MGDSLFLERLESDSSLPGPHLDLARSPHALNFSMLWPPTRDNLKNVEANSGFGLQGNLTASGGNTGLSCSSLPSFGSTPRVCYIYRLAAAAHGEGSFESQGSAVQDCAASENAAALWHSPPASFTLFVLPYKPPGYLLQLGVGTECAKSSRKAP